MPRSRRILFTVPVFVLFCALLGGIYSSHAQSTKVNNDADIDSNIRQLARVYSAIEQNYADAIEPDKLAEKLIYGGAIPGMIRTLDPHSNFIDSKSFALMREERRGHYYGVGMMVQLVKTRVTVTQPFEGSPAFRAGLRPGDGILKVDARSCDGLGTSDVAALLKGPRGTQVKVLVERTGWDQPLEFTLIRDEIPRPSVDLAYLMRPGIGYLRINAFMETTGQEAKAALNSFNPKTLRGLVLDLRGNRGGLVSEAVSVSDMFLAKGQVIVSHHGRSSPEKVFKARSGNDGLDYPVVVLVDRDTASASEIVAGALQDHDRALVVGETTFGKGLVQNEYQLSQDTGLLLTIARYYTPSGRLIQRNFDGVPLYDYLYARDENSKEELQKPRQIRLTDSGRPMFGGGGITPDEKVPYEMPGRLMRELLGRGVFMWAPGGIYVSPSSFSRSYLAAHKTVSRDFEVNDRVITEFRAFLDREKIACTDQELQQNLGEIKRRIKQDVMVSLFGKLEADRLGLDADPQVLKGIDLLPKAKTLADNAHRIVAQRLENQKP
jgi:carboxyl-terminal processing protease